MHDAADAPLDARSARAPGAPSGGPSVAPTLVLADLHADPAALDAILQAAFDPAFADRLGPVERVVNLGDVVGRGRDPRGLVEAMMDLEAGGRGGGRGDGDGGVGTVWLAGNHEEHLLETGEVLAGGDLCRRAHEDLLEDKALLNRLAALPDRAVLEGGVLCVHGGPVDPAALGTGPLVRRTWQRLADQAGSAMDGHRITAEMAFDALAGEVGPGGLLLLGHEHDELLLERRPDGAGGGDGRSIGPPVDAARVSFATAAGRVTGRSAVRRPGAALLARVGLGARHDGSAHFGYVAGGRVHLLAVEVEGTGRP